VENRATLFDVHWGAKALGTFRLGAPGEHNVSNALAALVAADTWNETCSGEAWGAKQRAGLVELLADFHGVKRRFEFVGEADDILVYNDYGHHPTEVARTVETAREFLDRPVVAIFQPHRYSRTLQLGHEFGPSFEQADRVIITELYSAFEEPIPGVSGQIVLDAVRAANPVKQVYFAPTLEDAHRLAMEITLPGDALFCLGAGNIGALPARLLESLQEREMAQSAVTS
jgi:UDP-N-acetylmuramate--alanine ligase